MNRIMILALATNLAVSFLCWPRSVSAQKGSHCDIPNKNCRSGFSESFCQVINGELVCSETGRCCTSAEPPLRPNEVSLDGLEVTQSIQDMSQSVTLVAGKPTWARAYLSSSFSSPITVYAFLRVTNTSNGKSILIFPRAGAILDPAKNNQLRAKREAPLSQQASFDFVIPNSFATGPLEFKLTGVTNSATGTLLTCSDCDSQLTRVSFVCSPPLRLRLVGIATGATTGQTAKGLFCNVKDNYCRTGFSQRFCQFIGNDYVCEDRGTCCTPPPPPKVYFAPSAMDYALVRSWLGRAYPVPNVLGDDALLVTDLQQGAVYQDVNAMLAALRAIDVGSGAVDPRTHYVGLVSTALLSTGAASDIPSGPDPTVVATALNGPPSAGIADPDATIGDWFTGHELGHALGRKHPGFCNQKSDDPNFPFPMGQISTNDGAFVGLDLGDFSNGIVPVVLPGISSFDIMTYCQQLEWPSSYSYEGIRQRLLEEDPRACSEGNTSSGLSVQTGQFLSIVARVNLTTKTASILSVNRVKRAQMPERVDENKASIRVFDRRGEILNEYFVKLRLGSELREDEERRAIIDAYIRNSPAISRIELLLDGQVLDQLNVSEHAPVVENIRVLSATDDNLTIVWAANDQDADKLKYIVQISSDSKRWETIAIDLRENQLTLTRAMIGDGKRPGLRVIANDGFHSSKPASIDFREWMKH